MYRLPEVWDEMKTDTMLHGVNAGDVRTTQHRPDSRPSYRQSLILPVRLYILYCLRTSYSSSRVS